MYVYIKVYLSCILSHINMLKIYINLIIKIIKNSYKNFIVPIK